MPFAETVASVPLTVTVPPDCVTLIPVPSAKERVPPRDMSLEVEPSVTAIVLLASFALAIEPAS